MKINLGKINWEGRWYDFGEHEPKARIKIRPRKRSQTKFVMRDDGIVFSGPERLDTFKYCLIDWEGFFDLNESPIKMTDEIKEQLFESGLGGISDFVLMKNAEMFNEMAEQEKN